MLGLKASDTGGGAAAFRLGSEQFCEDGPASTMWNVSGKTGNFEEASVTCIGQEGDTLIPSAEQQIDEGKLINRSDAEAILTSKAVPGCFVMRKSTSVPDSYVLSVWLRPSTIEHVLVKVINLRTIAIIKDTTSCALLRLRSALSL